MNIIGIHICEFYVCFHYMKLPFQWKRPSLKAITFVFVIS